MIRDDSPTAGRRDLADPQQRVRLIDGKGKQIGIMTLAEARMMAQSQGAKLREIAPTANPPIYRLMESGEHKKRFET
jgi:translation initiation factor IF-3